MKSHIYPTIPKMHNSIKERDVGLEFAKELKSLILGNLERVQNSFEVIREMQERKNYNCFVLRQREIVGGNSPCGEIAFWKDRDIYGRVVNGNFCINFRFLDDEEKLLLFGIFDKKRPCMEFIEPDFYAANIRIDQYGNYGVHIDARLKLTNPRTGREKETSIGVNKTFRNTPVKSVYESLADFVVGGARNDLSPGKIILGSLQSIALYSERCTKEVYAESVELFRGATVLH